MGMAATVPADIVCPEEQATTHYGMQAVILVGIQGSGKSTFYRERFSNTHLRISLDITGTRPRERRLLELCIAQGKDFVVDNTNATPEARSHYIQPANSAGYEVICYFFPKWAFTPRPNG
jgi:predicted kinase